MPYSGPNDTTLPENVQSLSESDRETFVATFNSAYAECEKRGGGDCESKAFAIANASASKELESPDETALLVGLALDLMAQGETLACTRCGVELTSPDDSIADIPICAACTIKVTGAIVERFHAQLEKHFQPKDKRIALPFRNKRNAPIEGFKLLPNRMWIAAYSNTQYDLEDERFSRKGFEDDIIFSRQNDLMPQLWFFHLPVPHGETLYMGLFGDHAVAIGKFYEGEIADKMIAYYEKHPDLAVSHGYVYNPDDLNEKGVYEKFHTFEISPLPRGKEANPITVFNLLEDEMSSKLLNPEAVAELEKALGQILAGQALESGKEHADAGIKAIQGFKAAGENEDPDKKKEDDETDDMPFTKELLAQVAGIAAKAAAGLVEQRVKAFEVATEKLAKDVAAVLLAQGKRISELETHGAKTLPTSPAGEIQHKGLDITGLLADMQLNGEGNSDKQLGGQPAFMSVLDGLMPGQGNGRR